MIQEIKRIIKSEKLDIDLNLDNDWLIEIFQTEVNWGLISMHQKLSEDFIEKFQDKFDWYYISMHQKLPESFIEKFQNKVDWIRISVHQNLSEKFIEKFQDRVDWGWVSKYQKLSEKFIEKFQDKVHWEYISKYQKLSEGFIEQFQKKVHWFDISIYQKLSEKFIEKFQDKVDWGYISKYQKLSENFIEKFQDKVYLPWISKYQKLSKSFIKKHNLKISQFNMFYFSKKQKLEKLNSKKNVKYEMDGNFIVAYKSTRYGGYSTFNFQYQYEVGKTYESHADGNFNEENSFGLSVWTKKDAIEFYPNGELYKVKVHIDDLAAVVHYNHKLRCSKIEIIEKIY